MSFTPFRIKNYTSVSLAPNTARTPDIISDTQVIITFTITSIITNNALISIQVDNTGGGTFVTVGNVGSSTIGVVIGVNTPITFIVPAGSQYKYIITGSGTVAVLKHYEVIL